MNQLREQFQEETKLSFKEIPINGVHVKYINWLEAKLSTEIDRVSFDKGYDLGYKDATSEACKEIEKNYRPNEH